MGIYSTFLQEFARSHNRIGAVAPSSRFLAKEMLHGMELGSSKLVVEYGPGTGSFTGAIVAQLGSHRSLYAIAAASRQSSSIRSSPNRSSPTRSSMELRRLVTPISASRGSGGSNEK